MIWRSIAMAVLVCLAAATWVSATLAQDLRMGGANSTGLDLNSSPRFDVWRTVTLGIHKGVDAYRNALDAAKIKIGDAADEILGRPAFPYVTSKTEVQLGIVEEVALSSSLCGCRRGVSCTALAKGWAGMYRPGGPNRANQRTRAQKERLPAASD
jgi:hypothetical protein